MVLSLTLRQSLRDGLEQFFILERLGSQTTAPAFIARTHVGISPWLLMKTIGNWQPAATSVCCNARPLSPGNRTSMSTQPKTSKQAQARKSSPTRTLPPDSRWSAVNGQDLGIGRHRHPPRTPLEARYTMFRSSPKGDRISDAILVRGLLHSQRWPPSLGLHQVRHENRSYRNESRRAVQSVVRSERYTSEWILIAQLTDSRFSPDTAERLAS